MLGKEKQLLSLHQLTVHTFVFRIWVGLLPKVYDCLKFLGGTTVNNLN